MLDYEYDGKELHERCGGKTYYTSRSGFSGAGYLMNLGALMPLGSYRVDTARNDFQYFISTGKVLGEYGDDCDIQVAVPYTAHTEDKTEILGDYPTVVKFKGKIVYCDFFRNFADVLKTAFLRKELPEGGRCILKKTFSGIGYYGRILEEEVSMEFYDLCSMDRTPNPEPLGVLSGQAGGFSGAGMQRTGVSAPLGREAGGRYLRPDDKNRRHGVPRQDPAWQPTGDRRTDCRLATPGGRCTGALL